MKKIILIFILIISLSSCFSGKQELDDNLLKKEVQKTSVIGEESTSKSQDEASNEGQNSISEKEAVDGEF